LVESQIRGLTSTILDNSCEIRVIGCPVLPDGAETVDESDDASIQVERADGRASAYDDGFHLSVGSLSD
jgi:hypothetical protein